MNLTERAEIRKETFYKLTNSAEVPTAPSEGGRNLMQRTDKLFTMGYGITNTAWDDDKKRAYLDLTDPNNNPAKQAEILPQGQFYNFKPTKGMTYTQSILIDTDATFNPNGQPQNSWFTSQGHNMKQGCFEQLSETTYRFWSTYTWQLEGIALRAFDWYGLHTVLGFRNSGTYLAFYKPKLETSDQPSEWSLAPEDLGWSMDTLVPTQQQRYLWKFEYVYYSDGSVEVTSPTNISIAGADGTNGQTSHVHFAFADNATGGGFSLTTPKAYMGWYADFNEAASTDPTKYRWGKWKGDQGLPGKPGADGKTSYFHMAYAESADGRTGFSFKESGQQYQGYYTDFTQTSSTDPTKYTWMDRRAGVKVGGKNLLLYTVDPWKAPNDYYQFSGVTKTDEMLNGSIVYKTHTAWASLRSNWGKQLIDRKNVKIGDEFTYSVYVRTDQETPIKARLFFRYSGQSNAEDMTGEKLITQEWQRFTKTFTVTQKMLSDSSKLSWVGFEQTTNSEDGKYVYYACNMLEEGNVPTPWTQALEDVQADIDSKADQTLTQEQLNALAEKNNLIKAEMEAKASIDTVDKWITAYENYVKANDADKAKSEQALKEASERILGMRYEVNDLKFAWDAIDRFMSFQNEGLIIGKKDGSAYAKFSDDRISLFSGSSEVMYISQGTLNIANGIFTKTIQIGRFRFETHPADADMLVLRYLGG